MTHLLERWTGADPEPEVTRVTTPRPHTPGVPWWAGVYGLDPAIPVEDWALAAQCTGMACAAYVFGTGAGYAEKLFSRKGSPAKQFTDWLLAASSPEDATRSRLALRLTCEQAEAPDDADGILTAVGRLLDSCSPGRR
jgi:hypothetical protein